jgi:hypothetical protein
MRKIFLVLIFAISLIFPSSALADCTALDGTACIPPSGYENETIAPPIIPPVNSPRPPGHENDPIAPLIFPPENSPRPPGHENDPIAPPVYLPSIENNSKPPFEINYLRQGRFDIPYFSVPGHGDHLEKAFDNNYSFHGSLHRSRNNYYTSRSN